MVRLIGYGMFTETTISELVAEKGLVSNSTNDPKTFTLDNTLC